MIQWLKDILGDSYTEDIDKKVSAEIGKSFVSKTDFNTKSEDLKTAQTQLADANIKINDFKNLDIDGIKKAADDWKDKYETAQRDHAAKLDSMELDGKIDSALAQAKARNVVAAKALLDMDTLRASKNRDADIKTAIDTLTKENGFMFGEAETQNSGGSHGATGGDYSKMSDEEYYSKMMKKE